MGDMNPVSDEIAQVSDIASSECDPVELGAASKETQGGFIGNFFDGAFGLQRTSS
jgi:hypothetical protein